MNTKHFWNQLTLFIVGLLLLLVVREYFSLQLIKNGIESYRIAATKFLECPRKYTS